MLFVETLTQTLVYLCFAILMGGFILYLIPNTIRPEINLQRGSSCWQVPALPSYRLYQFFA